MKNNPYVGPRPYERIDQGNFYGRKREARDLLSLVLAERVVLFYAPSGAGKTSLLNAQVIPALEADDFRVLPATRVGSDLPPRINSQDIKNIFVFSTLMGLAEDRVPVETLIDHTLLSFLRQLCPEGEDANDNPPILILDQFEEILTTHRDRWQDARGFFEQMREALRGMPSLGVVFSMREDYVAGMDPYASLLPRRLRARFRMERLDRRGALEAMKKPAQNAGCPFDPGVAERLVDDLRRIKTVQNSTQQPDDQTTVLGPFIEPVQLQVVCSRLWENLPEQEDNAIQWEEVEEFGNVDRALTDFYENALVQCVEETDVSERQLRSWFGEHLITPMQTRGLVLRGEHETNGLPNEAVDVLSNRHLIRADMRAGARWYELSHDRLVDPILASNAAWDIARETPLRMMAKRWQETRDEDLVYRDRTLAEALIWSQNHPDEVEPYEIEFLEVSQKVQRGRNRARWLRTLVIILLAIGIVATAWSAYVAQKAEATAVAAQEEAEIKRQEAEQAQAEAETERQSAQAAQAIAEENQLEAERQARLALSGQLAVQAQNTLEDSPQRSLLLALEALNITLEKGESRVPAAENSLREALSNVGSTLLIGHDGEILTVAFSPDGRWLATASTDGTARLWQVDAPEQVVVLHGQNEPVEAMALSSDGQWLATGSQLGTVRLWNMQDLTEKPIELAMHNGPVQAIMFSPDASLLVTGGEDGIVQLWRTNDLMAEPVILARGQNPIKAMAFAPNGYWLATGDEGGSVRLHQVEDTAQEPLTLGAHEDAVILVTFSPDGQWLATGSWDGTARLWNVAPVFGTRVNDAQEIDSVALEHTGTVLTMAFDQSGHWLASGSDDRMVRVWDITMFNVETSLPLNTERLSLSALPTREHTSTAPPMALYGHEAPIVTMAFDPNGQWLATGSDDRTVRLWSVGNPAAEAVVLRGHEAPVNTVAFSPDGNWLATGSDDSTANLWEMDNLSPEPMVLRGHEASVNAVAFSPDGLWLATGGSDFKMGLWSMDDPEATPIVLFTDGDVNTVAFSPDGRWLATGSLDGLAQLWNVSAMIETGENVPVTELEVSRGDDVAEVHVVFSPGSRWLVVWSNDVVARLLDLSDPEAEPVALHGHTEAVHAAAFSPDERWLATGGFDSTVRVWDLDNLTAEPIVLTGPQDIVVAMTFSPDGRWLAVAHSDIVILWDLEDLDTEPEELYGYRSFIIELAFSPDGHWLAAGGDNSTVGLWEISDPNKRSVTLSGHEAPVNTIAFSSDSRWLATGSDDRTARLWDMDDPTTDPVVLYGHSRDVTSVAFSPDGHWLATGSLDTTTRLWTLSLEELIDLACNSAGRNLTYEEWQWYIATENDELYEKTCSNLPVHPSVIDRVLNQAEDSAWEGDVETASLTYETVQQWTDEIGDAQFYYEVCWSASVDGFVEVVLTSCNRAVELEPDNNRYRLGRGLARALTGDYAGAIEDLEFVAERGEGEDQAPDEIDMWEIEEWIAELEAGQNPFTQEVLESLP